MRMDVLISPPFRVGLLGGGGLRMCYPVPEAFGPAPDPEWEWVVHAISQGAGYLGGLRPLQPVSDEDDERSLSRLADDGG